MIWAIVVLVLAGLLYHFGPEQKAIRRNERKRLRKEGIHI